jgi:hypothetical protein
MRDKQSLAFPVPDGVMLEVHTIDDKGGIVESTLESLQVEWEYETLVAFRILGPAEGWVL